MKITYTPKGVCSKAIHIEVNDGHVGKVSFVGGCSGNTQGVCRLIEGMEVHEAIARIKGIRCGMKPTSCPDQLAQALESMVE